MTDTQILLLLLKATEEQLHTVHQYLKERGITDLQDTNLDEIQFLPGLEHFDFDPASFANFSLSNRPQRSGELTMLIQQLAQSKMQWLMEVRNATWHKSDWGAAAFRLRSGSHLERIGRAETYAILAASMHYQKFARPAKLKAILWNHDRSIAENAIQEE